MASFKINIADPKVGKSFKTEVKDNNAAPFMGLNVGEKIEGGKIGIDGYEFQITGGTDFSGFPMRKGILGIRKKISIYAGLGFKGGLKGMRKRKTVCGHKINETISAINLKVVKEGTKKLSELFGKKESEGDTAKKDVKKPEQKVAKEEKKPEAKKEVKEAKPEAKKEEVKESKPEAKKEEPKEAKAEQPKQESKEQKK